MNLIKSIKHFFYIRMIEKELSQMSDRELDDIGICRCDIPRIAREDANEKA